MAKLRHENSIAQFTFCVGQFAFCVGQFAFCVGQFANSAAQFANSASQLPSPSPSPSHNESMSEFATELLSSRTMKPSYSTNTERELSNRIIVP